MNELGVSRTPVGEAILQLANEGHVQQDPRFGMIVCSIEPRDIEELYEIRKALECFEAAKAARRISSLQLAQFDALCTNIEKTEEDSSGDAKTPLDLPTLRRFLAANLTFHLMIVKSAGNQRILDTIQATRTMSQIVRMRHHEPDKSVVERASQMHRNILRALANGDPVEASLRMGKHIRVSREESQDGNYRFGYWENDALLNARRYRNLRFG